METGTFYLVAGINAPSNQKKEITIRRHAKNHNAKVMEYIEKTVFEEEVKIGIISLEAFEENPNRLGVVRKRRALPKTIVPEKVEVENSGNWINNLYNDLFDVPEKVEAENSEKRRSQR